MSARVEQRHEEAARELLSREYGPTRHPADPGRNFSLSFTTTSRLHQISELAQALAEAEEMGAEPARRVAKSAEVLVIGSGQDGGEEIVFRCSSEEARRWGPLLYKSAQKDPP